MVTKRADEVRALCAARIVAQVSTLTEMVEPYFLAKGKRSFVHRSFCVGIGRSVPGNDRQKRSEGTQAHTVIKVLVAYQLTELQHLAGETAIGVLRNAIAVALLADWSPAVAIVWAEDGEPTTTETMLWFESQFLALHQLPLE